MPPAVFGALGYNIRKSMLCQQFFCFFRKFFLSHGKENRASAKRGFSYDFYCLRAAEQPDNDSLNRKHNRKLNEPRYEQGLKRRTENEGYHQCIGGKRYYKAIEKCRENRIIPACLAFIQHKAENNAGYCGSNGKAGEIGARGKNKRAEQVCHGSGDCGPPRTEKHSRQDLGCEAEPYFHEAGIYRQRTGKNHVDSYKHGGYRQFFCCIFHVRDYTPNTP